MAISFLFIMMLAIVLIALSTCQFLAVGLASGRATADVRHRRAVDVRGLRQAAQIARLNSELRTSQAGSSLPWRVMEIAEIIDESADCRSFYLIDPYRQPLAAFRPGQHVMVRPALAGAYQTTRCYSLSSSPDSRYWRITVKRQEPDGDGSRQRPTSAPRSPGHAQVGLKSGGLSAWLHETIGVGDCLLVGGPNGHFYLPEDNRRPLVLLAAGVGITPMASMLRWSLEATPQRPVRLLYQARDLDHWPLGQTLHDWTRNNPTCQVTSYFSQATQADLALVMAGSTTRPNNNLQAEFLLGKFDTSDVVRGLAGGECDYFMCGPNAWMETLRQHLLSAGVADNRIHWESFGSPTKTPTGTRDEATSALAVRFEASGVDALWCSRDQSLWELARQHQVDIPSGCLSGVCGCCRVKVLSGRVAYDQPPSLELADDECLACIAHPQTPCTIDA